MKRKMRMSIWALVLLCGCAGRVNTDLLQARIREQASQLSETQREMEKTRSELKRSRLETAQLKSELAQTGQGSEPSPVANAKIRKIHIFPMASGGLNKDEFPGDDAVVVQFVPLDRDNEPTKLPGDVEFTLIDPRLPESDREVGRWKFSADDCRGRWTRGIASSGFQFNLPLEQSPLHQDLVVKMRYRTSDEQLLEATQAVKVVVPTGHATLQSKRTRRRPVKVVDESNEILPPVGDANAKSANAADDDLPDWARDDFETPQSKSGIMTRHSANFTDATIPQLR